MSKYKAQLRYASNAVDVCSGMCVFTVAPVLVAMVSVRAFSSCYFLFL